VSDRVFGISGASAPASLKPNALGLARDPEAWYFRGIRPGLIEANRGLTDRMSSSQGISGASAPASLKLLRKTSA